MPRWYESRFTGLFAQLRHLPPRPHDPPLPMCGGSVPPWGPRTGELAIGGAGWNEEQAEMACVGEAIERWQPYRLPGDRVLEASLTNWPLNNEPAVDPQRWVLFHPEQYAQPGFPFAPLTGETVCHWVCCRYALSGMPCWVPEEIVFLYPSPDSGHQFTPGLSTGLSCGRGSDAVLLRGLQEVIERDGVVGAWWGGYPLEEWDADRVFGLLGEAVTDKLQRPNLSYRFYRVVTPFAGHVTVVTLTGDDREGFCFSTGSACRETRAASWTKSLLEAVQGRHYVRYLKAKNSACPVVPTDFAEHAVYYSHHPERLRATVLERASTVSTSQVSRYSGSLPPWGGGLGWGGGLPCVRHLTPKSRNEDSSQSLASLHPPHPNPPPQGGREPLVPREDEADSVEDLAALTRRLGPERPVLFRNLTPPALAQEFRDWRVLRVLVPGLQPLHGDHRLPHLGGPLWQPRGASDWLKMPPHPFA